MTAPVLDKNVLVDIFVKTRPRHQHALALARQLERSPYPVQVPMHALFELAAAMKAEQAAGRLTISKAFTEAAPFPLTFIPINEQFFTRYFDESLPQIKAGDLIFLALAKGTGASLISEDEQLLRAAKGIGIVAYTIAEYLATKT